MSVQLRNGPPITVEAALISNPLDASPTWTDVSARLRSCHIRRGRSHELDRMQAGIMSLVFGNATDLWNPWNTAGSYYGNLLSYEQSIFHTGWANQSNTTVTLGTMTSIAAGDMTAETPRGTSGIPVVAGKQYNAFAEFESSGTGRVVGVDIGWFNAAGTFLSSSTGPTVFDGAGVYTQTPTFSPLPTAPANAAYANVVTRVTATGGAGEAHNVRNVSLNAGTSMVWGAGGRDGNLKPVCKIRVKAVWNAVTYYLFTGYIESIEHAWPSPTYSETTVTAVDGFKVLSLAKAAKTTFYDGIIAKTPAGYWRWDEKGTGSVVNGLITAVDSSGNSRDGTYKGSVQAFQQPGFLPAEIGASVDLGVRQGWIETPIAACPSGTGNWSVVIPVYLRSFSQASPVDKLWHVIDVGSQHVEINIQTNGKVRFWVTDGTNGGYIDSNTEVPLFRWFMVTAVKSGTTGPGNWKLYFDKTDVSGSTSTDGTGNVNITTNAMLVGGRTSGGVSVAAMDGLVDEHAIIGSALSSGDVTTIYDNSYGLATTSLAGARIGKLLDIAGHPTADRSLDAGQFSMQPVKGQLFNNSPLPLILDYVDSEGYPAAFFFNGQGYAVFHDRAHSTPASSGTFGDGVSELKVAVGSAPTLDDEDLWPTVVCQADDGAAKMATDAAATARYVDRTLSRTGLKNANDANVQTLADDLLARYKEPAERIKGLTILPYRDRTNLFPHALGRELNDRILYNRADFPGDGSGLALDLRIEGITHEFDATTWRTTWMAVPT